MMFTTYATAHAHTHANQSEFRVNAQEADPTKIAQHQETAVRGLSQLQAYTGLRDADANWEVKMEGKAPQAFWCLAVCALRGQSAGGD